MTRIEDHWRRREVAWIELNELKGRLARLDIRRLGQAEVTRLDSELSEACASYNFECAAIGACYNERHRPADVPRAREL